MNVKIRVRALEKPWGSGPTAPVVREATISDDCPRCGAKRGQPRSTRQHEDGVTYYVDTWSNPCGHSDLYGAVAIEAGLTKEFAHG